MNELPTRGPNDPPIAGPHRIVHPDGTVQHVFAGPNTMPKPRPSVLREVGYYLYTLAFVFSMVAGIITAGLLVLEYPQLTDTARLACGTITVLVCAWAAARHIRRRKMAS